MNNDEPGHPVGVRYARLYAFPNIGSQKIFSVQLLFLFFEKLLIVQQCESNQFCLIFFHIAPLRGAGVSKCPQIATHNAPLAGCPVFKTIANMSTYDALRRSTLWAENREIDHRSTPEGCVMGSNS